MARTKEFDPEVALEAAVKLFWRRGYEQTSLEMLLRAMRISKQSLYDTFGDKRALYLQAMKRYRATTNQALRELFAKQGSVRGAFAKLFRSMAQESREELQRGCLLLSANLTRDVQDGAIERFLRDNQREVEQIFREALGEARARGDLDANKSPAALARYFVSTVQGMRALGRLNHDGRELEQIGRLALGALD